MSYPPKEWGEYRMSPGGGGIPCGDLVDTSLIPEHLTADAPHYYENEGIYNQSSPINGLFALIAEGNDTEFVQVVDGRIIGRERVGGQDSFFVAYKRFRRVKRPDLKVKAVKPFPEKPPSAV